MSQVPLAPPPPTGGPLDGWLYLLWRRLTQAGQILWGTITPGTSADVAAVVTDETGTAGNLVFSGNPTLQVVTVDGLFYQGDTTEPAGFTPFLGGMFSTNSFAGTNLIVRKCTSNAAGNTASASFLRSRGTAAAPETVVSGDSVGGFIGGAYDGTNYKAITFINFGTEGTVSTGVVPGNMQFLTANASGTLTESFRLDSSQKMILNGVFLPKQATTAGAPAYVKGGMYFDTTLNKLRIGGATAWETVTSV